FPSTDTPPSATYPLSLHDALPIFLRIVRKAELAADRRRRARRPHAHAPVGDVDHVRAPVRHQPAGVVVVPPEIEVEAVLVERTRSEEHTSELQSRFDLVCRLLLEK